MFFNKKKDKEKSVSAAEMRDMGAVGFTMDDVRQVQDQKESPNAKAYEYMVQAMAVSANYMGDTITEEGVRLDDVYPTTYEETMKMDELLDKSERAVNDENDEEYNKMITELRGIVGWSRRRHFNFSWLVILGTLITIFVVLEWSSSDQQEKDRRHRMLEQVKAWSEEPDSITDAMAYDSVDNYITKKTFVAPVYYKAYRIKFDEYWLKHYEDGAESTRQILDTISNKDLKAFYEDQLAYKNKAAKKHADSLEEERKWDMKDAKKAAIKYQKKEYGEAARAAAFSWCFMIFFLLLIPLYIFANHSWGYVITKYREESEKLEKIKRWGFAAAAGLFGAAAAMEYLPDTKVTTYYSDGSTTTHTESNAGNFFIVAIKIGLLLLALAIIAVVSTGIMLYSTITGLMRNYDWKAIYNSAKETAVRVKG